MSLSDTYVLKLLAQAHAHKAHSGIAVSPRHLIELLQELLEYRRVEAGPQGEATYPEPPYFSPMEEP